MLLQKWEDLEDKGHLDFLPGKGFSGGPKDWNKHVRNLKKLLPNHPPRWKLVQPGDKLKEGYILISATHLMISLGPPDTNGYVLIADSTGTPHGPSDSRVPKKKTGMGKGKIQFKEVGTQFKFAWSTKFKNPKWDPIFVVRPLA